MTKGCATMENEQRASVIMLRGHGEDRLRQAMMQGLIRDELTADVQDVLRQIEAVKRDNQMLSDSFRHQKQENERFKKIYFDALLAAEKAKRRKKQRNDIYSYAIVAGTIFIVVLLSSIICKLIFG